MSCLWFILSALKWFSLHFKYECKLTCLFSHCFFFLFFQQFAIFIIMKIAKCWELFFMLEMLTMLTLLELIYVCFTWCFIIIFLFFGQFNKAVWGLGYSYSAIHENKTEICLCARMAFKKLKLYENTYGRLMQVARVMAN